MLKPRAANYLADAFGGRLPVDPEDLLPAELLVEWLIAPEERQELLEYAVRQSALEEAAARTYDASYEQVVKVIGRILNERCARLEALETAVGNNTEHKLFVTASVMYPSDEPSFTPSFADGLMISLACWANAYHTRESANMEDAAYYRSRMYFAAAQWLYEQSQGEAPESLFNGTRPEPLQTPSAGNATVVNIIDTV